LKGEVFWKGVSIYRLYTTGQSMASFNYACKLTAVRDWPFAQSKQRNEGAVKQCKPCGKHTFAECARKFCGHI